MKRNILITLLAFFSHCAAAQVHIGSHDRPDKEDGPGTFSNEYISRLKTTTTVFVLLDDDFKNLPVWEQVISRSWTITPYKIIRYSQLPEFIQKPKHSFFSIGGWAEGRSTGDNPGFVIFPTFDLYIPGYNKNGEVKLKWSGEAKDKDYYARIILFLEQETYNKTFSRSRSLNVFDEDIARTGVKYVYERGTVYNWTPGMMQSYFSYINRMLKNEQTADVNEDFAEKEKLKRLATDTLYIPEYVNMKYDMMTASEDDGETFTNETLKKAYKYPARVVSTQELDKLITERKTNVCYLNYVRLNGKKYVSVIESGTGKMLYSNVKNISNNLKPKDMAQLAKQIK